MNFFFLVYKSLVENQLGKMIKALRFDHGGEYLSNYFTNFCESHGINQQVTTPYTQQQNGIAERKNRTLVELVNAMLLSSGLPLNL